MEGECQGSKMCSYSMVNVHVHVHIYCFLQSAPVASLLMESTADPELDKKLVMLLKVFTFIFKILAPYYACVQHMQGQTNGQL